MADVVGKLEEEALRRKNRLRELRGKRLHDEQQSTINDESTPVPKPVFRNYKPETEEFQEPTATDDHAGIVEKEVGTHLEMMQTPIVIEEIDIANLAPRKPDWDLKRDVSKKLEKLERRTQKAIAELIRERLKAGQEQDILQAVNIATSATTASVEQQNLSDD
ncbi:coiled-coil domain-containing protein 12 [Anopheles maculipalpis]|uniref:coiled-coil domain-containing protein 12 n=1 Tax=Anopheles maculipalpis TaxID=1496333 RepID=UPI002159A3E9|nr:coiled-coil domain-containing protein 12 [Anopheles maculipalpis]